MRMARPGLFGVALAAILALATAASPQSTPAPPTRPAPTIDPGESTVVQELEVIAPRPGPRLWKVTKGFSELVIIGSVSPIPHLQAWPSKQLEAALDGAVVLLMPPKAHLGFFAKAGFALSGGGAFKAPHGRTLKSELPDPVYARFAKESDRIHSDMKKYQGLKPAPAGFFLLSDFRRAAGLSELKPATTIVKLAKAHNVPVRAVGDYDAGPLLKAAANLSDAAGVSCATDALDQIKFETDNAPDAGRGWAKGDLEGIRAHYSTDRVERCLENLPNFSALVERGTADATREMGRALDRPGKTVAVVDIAFLLRPNGVLDRLKAQGATISLPGA